MTSLRKVRLRSRQQTGSIAPSLTCTPLATGLLSNKRMAACLAETHLLPWLGDQGTQSGLLFSHLAWFGLEELRLSLLADADAKVVGYSLNGGHAMAACTQKLRPRKVPFVLTPDPQHPLHPATELGHLFDDSQSHYGTVNPPVYHASTYTFPDYTTWKANVTGEQPREFTYNISHNPTTKLLERKIAHLEGAADCIASSSGMSAISMVLIGLLNAGDHALCVNTVYGPTRLAFTSHLPRFGVEATFFPASASGDLSDWLRPNTRMIFIESPSSGLFQIQDIRAVAALAKERDIWTVIDNTWATPLFQKPIELGIDVSVHAGTKYIGGHSDIMFGLTAGNAASMAQIRKVYTMLGACPGPDDSYLALRGLRTLHVRLKQHEANGLKVARWLEEQPDVIRVNHPGLESFPGHALHRSQTSGDSGLFSFQLEPRGEAARAAFVNSLRFFGLGYSWGGYESLLSPLAFQYYGNDALRQELGLADDIFRVSIGLEDADDLIADLAGALAAYRER